MSISSITFLIKNILRTIEAQIAKILRTPSFSFKILVLIKRKECSYHCMRPISASRQPKIAFLYEFRFCLLPKIAFLYEFRFCLLFAISCWTSGFISQITNKKKHHFVTNKRAKIEGDKDVSFDATFTYELLSMPLRLSVLLTICLRKKTYINESTSWSRQYLWQWFDGSIVHCTMV